MTLGFAGHRRNIMEQTIVDGRATSLLRSSNNQHFKLWLSLFSTWKKKKVTKRETINNLGLSPLVSADSRLAPGLTPQDCQVTVCLMTSADETDIWEGSALEDTQMLHIEIKAQESHNEKWIEEIFQFLITWKKSVLCKPHNYNLPH